MMKRLSKRLGKCKKPKHPSRTITDPLGSTKPITSTSTIIPRTADRRPSIPASVTIESTQVNQTGLEPQVPASDPASNSTINPLIPGAHPEQNATHSGSGLLGNAQNSLITSDLPLSGLGTEHAATTAFSPASFARGTGSETPLTRTSSNTHSSRMPSPDATQASTESKQKPLAQNSGMGFFANAQNIVITGGTFSTIQVSNTGEEHMKIPLLQKPNSSPIFTGRKDVLERLENIFVHRAESRLMSRRSCLLWGMGGIGKTQICLKFTEEMHDSFSHVFWVDASSHESITMSFKGISNIPAAQASGIDGSVEAVRQWIAFQEEWLIVFDNADDLLPEVVAKFFPPGDSGNILITSRNRSMGRVISFENIIEIGEMDQPDAIALLLRAGYLEPSAKHLQAARDIVTELGCIPLAVNHAGAYIEAGNCDIDKYLKQFSLHRQTLMTDAAFTGASNYSQTVYGTWDLSFKEIARRASGQSTTANAQAAQAAILILHICAFYHHSDISKDIFQSAAKKSSKYTIDSDVAQKLPQAINLLDHTLLAVGNDGQWDDFIFGQGVGILFAFSLIKRGQTPEMLSIHPLVHSWSREKMFKAEQQRICQMGSIILSCAIPWGFASQDYTLRRLIFPHIKANKLYASQIGLIEEYFDDKCNNFALVMMENGDWNGAEQLRMQVMDMRKKLLGAEHPDTLTSIANLATTYSNQGRWNEAEQLELQVMGIRKKMLGAEHPDTLTSMGNLAITYWNQGRWDEAEQLEIQVMDITKELFGTEHPDTLTSIANLASTYHNQGRYKEAEQLDIQVMDMTKKLLGAEHPDTLNSMANLASTYNHQRRWNESELLEIQVMDMRKKLLGEEHPDTLSSMANLASTYHNQGRWNEAEELEFQVLNMRKKLLGVEHPHTLTSMANIATIYWNQERWNEAEELELQVVNIRKKLFGTEHPDTLKSLSNLASIYRNQGKWNKAEQLEVQVMDINMKLYGSEHPDTLTSMSNLASTYWNQGRWNQAEQLDVQVMAIRKQLLGAEHPDTLTSMENLASTYYNQGKQNDAEQLDVQVMNMTKKLLGAEHSYTLHSMENLAITYWNQGRWNEAEQLEVQVMSIRKQLLGAEHPDTLKSLSNLARTYYNQKRYNEAEQLKLEIMNIWNKTGRG